MKNFTPILLIIISVATFFIFIDPTYNEVKVLLDQKEQNNTLITLAGDLRRKRDQLHQDFNNIGEENKRDLKKLLPETVDNVRLILDISNIADALRLTITNITVSGNNDPSAQNSQLASSPADAIGTITLGFSVVAPYDLFIELLRSLEESLRLVDIRSMTVSPGSTPAGGTSNVNYSYSVTLNTYWLR